MTKLYVPWKRIWSVSLTNLFSDDEAYRLHDAVTASDVGDMEKRHWLETSQVALSKGFMETYLGWRRRRTYRGSDAPNLVGLGMLAAHALTNELVFGLPYGKQTPVRLREVFAVEEMVTTSTGCGELAVRVLTQNGDVELVSLKNIAV